MKHLKGSLIFLLFFVCYFLSEPFFNFLSHSFDQSIREKSESSTIKNLEVELENMAKTFQIDYPFAEKKIYSKLLLQDPFTFFERIKILKGSEDGVKKNSAVINELGFVGVIESCSNHSSIVQLLPHKDTKISVKIGNTYGVLTSNELNELWIKELTNKEEFSSGQEVYTSGLTEIPGNIFVGKVTEIKKDELGLTSELKISSGVDYNKLSYFIILERENKNE